MIHVTVMDLVGPVVQKMHEWEPTFFSVVQLVTNREYRRAVSKLTLLDSRWRGWRRESLR